MTRSARSRPRLAPLPRRGPRRGRARASRPTPTSRCLDPVAAGARRRRARHPHTEREPRRQPGLARRAPRGRARRRARRAPRLVLARRGGRRARAREPHGARAGLAVPADVAAGSDILRMQWAVAAAARARRRAPRCSGATSTRSSMRTSQPPACARARGRARRGRERARVRRRAARGRRHGLRHQLGRGGLALARPLVARSRRWRLHARPSCRRARAGGGKGAGVAQCLLGRAPPAAARGGRAAAPRPRCTGRRATPRASSAAGTRRTRTCRRAVVRRAYADSHRALPPRRARRLGAADAARADARARRAARSAVSFHCVGGAGAAARAPCTSRARGRRRRGRRGAPRARWPADARALGGYGRPEKPRDLAAVRALLLHGVACATRGTRAPRPVAAAGPGAERAVAPTVRGRRPGKAAARERARGYARRAGGGARAPRL